MKSKIGLALALALFALPNAAWARGGLNLPHFLIWPIGLALAIAITWYVGFVFVRLSSKEKTWGQSPTLVFLIGTVVICLIVAAIKYM